MGIPSLLKAAGVPREHTPFPQETFYLDGDGLVHMRVGRAAGVDRRYFMNDFKGALALAVKEAESWKRQSMNVVVFFDGNSGCRKFLTSWKRIAKQFKNARLDGDDTSTNVDASSQSSSDRRTIPIALYKRVQKYALRKSSVRVVQCWGEADQEIACQANASNPPAFVVSTDSDMLIMADRFVHLSSFHAGEKGRYYSRKRTCEVLHVASPSFLPLYALLSGNDYVPDWILTPLQKALNAHVIYIAGAIAPKILSETLGLPAPCKSPPVLEVADAACRAFADSFDNSERAAALSRDTFRSVLSDAHATFCTPRPPECAVATPARALPAALKEAFARGWVGQELALLALKDADAVWKYTPLPELPSLPPAYAAALPVRKQVYRLLIPVCGGGPSLRVTEYSRDRLACPLREAVVVEASVPPAALSLEGLWGAAAGARPSAAEAVAYFLQGVLPQAPEHAETKQYIVECLKGDAALALAFLVGASGVLHMWELNALLIGLLMSTHFCAFAARKTGKDDVTDLLDAFVAANAKDAAQAHTGRFAHVGSVVLASLHSLVFADEMSRWSLFGGCDGTSPLTELLAGLNMEACLVPYADMRRLYDSMRFAEALPAEAELAGFIQRMRLSSAESGAGTFATSPFDCPDGVGDLTAYLLRAFFKRDYAVSRGGTAYRGAAADLDTDAFGKEFAALVRAKAEVLLRCLAYADREGACVLGRRQAAYRAWPVASLRLRVEPDGVATVGDAAKANLAEAHRRRSPVLVTAGGVGDLACSAAACVQGGALVLCGGGGTEDARSTTVSHSLHACGSGALLLEQACVAAGKKCVNLVPQTACVTDVRTLRARAAVVAGDENAVVLVAGHSWLASFRASGCPSEAVTSHGQLCLYNVTRDMREALWPFLPTAVSLGVFSVGPVERHFAVVVEADASADVPQEDAAQGGGRPPSVEVSERSAYY